MSLGKLGAEETFSIIFAISLGVLILKISKYKC
jgi:hypothetical protein